MREGGAAAKPDVLNKAEELPSRRDIGKLTQIGQEEVNREHYQIRRQNAQGPTPEEQQQIGRLIAPDWSEKLPSDQIPAEDEKQIDANPAEALNIAWQAEPENSGVVKDHQKNRKSTEKIESRLS
jgi:hypothetical protein